MKRRPMMNLFAVLLLLMASVLLPCRTGVAASKTYTPIGQYYGIKVKLGKYYVHKGGESGRWFGYSRKKNATEDQETTLPGRENAVANDAVIYSYRDIHDGYKLVGHSIFKMNMKNGSEKRIKIIKDKTNPMSDSQDGFIFGTAYGNKLYYNVTQKYTKSGGFYDRTYKLMYLDTKTKKVKTAKKNFEILGCTKAYIFGRSTKNVYYVFNLKKNKFYKMSGVPKKGLVITHAYKDKVYGAQFTGKTGEGYKKILLFSFNGAKKKIAKIKTLNAGADSHYLDGYFEVDSFKYTKDTTEFYKYNLASKKTTTTTARDYDYDLDPDYGDEEE